MGTAGREGEPMRVFRCALLLLATFLSLSAAAGAERLEIPGTGDSQMLLRALAARFEQTTPGAVVEIPASIGTVGGIKRLLQEEVAIARTARPLTPREIEDGLQQTIFAFSPVVFVANLESPCLKGVSAAEIVSIYRGEISNWSQLGDCPPHKIYVANREEGDSSRSVIESHVPGFADIDRFAGEIIYSTPEALAIISQYPFTIGFLPRAMALSSGLHFLEYEGVAPTLDNIRDGRYPLAVPLGIAWKHEPQGLARQFIDFLFSPEAAAIMNDMGAVAASKPAP